MINLKHIKPMQPGKPLQYIFDCRFDDEVYGEVIIECLSICLIAHIQMSGTKLKHFNNLYNAVNAASKTVCIDHGFAEVYFAIPVSKPQLEKLLLCITKNTALFIGERYGYKVYSKQVDFS